MVSKKRAIVLGTFIPDKKNNPFDKENKRWVINGTATPHVTIEG